jgi:hypothetical protein
LRCGLSFEIASPDLQRCHAITWPTSTMSLFYWVRPTEAINPLNYFLIFGGMRRVVEN